MLKESELIHQLGTIATQLVNSRKESEHYSQIKTVLSTSPFKYFKDGSMGKTESFLQITVRVPNGEEFELSGEYHSSSNYAHSDTKEFFFGNKKLRHLADQPSVVQLAYLIQIYGKPLRVSASYKNYDCWSGGNQIDEEWEIEFSFP